MGRQNIDAHGVSRFLVPRNMIGVGFTWNIFDGLDREKNIRKAKLSILTLELEREKAIDDLSVGIDKAYSSLQNALDNITALKSTISLSKELLKVREKSFLEGMATSTEVVDARVALSNVQLLYLAAYYQYDLSLMTLLSLSGIPDEFETYKSKGKTESFIFE